MSGLKTPRSISSTGFALGQRQLRTAVTPLDIRPIATSYVPTARPNAQEQRLGAPSGLAMSCPGRLAKRHGQGLVDPGLALGLGPNQTWFSHFQVQILGARPPFPRAFPVACAFRHLFSCLLKFLDAPDCPQCGQVFSGFTVFFVLLVAASLPSCSLRGDCGGVSSTRCSLNPLSSDAVPASFC